MTLHERNTIRDLIVEYAAAVHYAAGCNGQAAKEEATKRLEEVELKIAEFIDNVA